MWNLTKLLNLVRSLFIFALFLFAIELWKLLSKLSVLSAAHYHPLSLQLCCIAKREREITTAS